MMRWLKMLWPGRTRTRTLTWSVLGVVAGVTAMSLTRRRKRSTSWLRPMTRWFR
jgi:hypothetical protein